MTKKEKKVVDKATDVTDADFVANQYAIGILLHQVEVKNGKEQVSHVYKPILRDIEAKNNALSLFEAPSTAIDNAIKLLTDFKERLGNKELDIKVSELFNEPQVEAEKKDK